jgi:hypothetical protein
MWHTTEEAGIIAFDLNEDHLKGINHMKGKFWMPVQNYADWYSFDYKAMNDGKDISFENPMVFM